jgi:holo-[acyl-carrier protein] synthase
VIVGLGIDFLEISRVERELARGEWRQGDGIFTPGEIQYCSAASAPGPCFAVCFAAKEATMKALGVPVGDLALFREVEVGRDRDRGYRVVLRDRLKAESEKLGVSSIKLTVTQSATQAGAVVILEDRTYKEQDRTYL